MKPVHGICSVIFVKLSFKISRFHEFFFRCAHTHEKTVEILPVVRRVMMYRYDKGFVYSDY